MLSAVHRLPVEGIFADRFELSQLAASGGMATVFRARDRRSGEPIALKVLLAPTEELRARFLQEATSLESLDHPGIVKYRAHGVTEEGHAYLAMEWLSGEDLSSRLRRGSLRVEEAIALLRRLAATLTEVHELGIIH